ncbi:hypothetical protein [Pontibacter amylolyticus]|uniref:STAS/SEC14 domain-containing protein n=1 Tax=Pontibacter amylolyticus TaxID=1424080 RepID=A0ABQ1VU91_9BACT|nr:hypothetical protein [Pontibacter amylolyticus]GGF99520.1 hypothetical protein GCM10011323_00830 [Pontibacter amylolyticus]
MFHVHENKEQLVHSSDYLEIRVNAGEKLLLSDWQGWLDSAKGHAGCMKILDYVHEYKITKILNDNSKVTGHSGDTKWMGKVWIPGLREAGVQSFAWVYSYEFFTQLEIDNTVDSSSGIAMRTFFLPEDARQWLQAS